jgi:two-component system, cell cycle response regulator DivK
LARVLHIEDNPSNRKVVRYLLRDTPHQLSEATNGEEGLEMAFKERPDLIILDIQLPLLSGYEVAQRLREHEHFANTPIIAITSYALSGDDTKALQAGCNDYIAKPFRPQVLLDCLAKYLQYDSASETP